MIGLDLIFPTAPEERMAHFLGHAAKSPAGFASTSRLRPGSPAVRALGTALTLLGINLAGFSYDILLFLTPNTLFLPRRNTPVIA